MSSNRRLWVPNLQPLSLRSPTLHKPLHVSSPPWILLRLRFYRYHWDRLAPIYTLVEASKPSEIARALMHHPNISRSSSHVARTSMHRQPSHAPPRTKSALVDISPRWRHHCHITYWHHRPSSADITRHVSWRNHWQAVDLGWLWLLTFCKSWLLQSRFSLPSFLRRFHFYSPFLHILLLNEE